MNNPQPLYYTVRICTWQGKKPGKKTKTYALHVHKCIHIILRRKSLGNYSPHICNMVVADIYFVADFFFVADILTELFLYIFYIPIGFRKALG